MDYLRAVVNYLKSKYPNDFCSEPDCTKFEDLMSCRRECGDMLCSAHVKDHYVYCSGCGKETCKGWSGGEITSVADWCHDGKGGRLCDYCERR